MFRTHQNTIGNLAIVLLFVGGCIFLLTGSWMPQSLRQQKDAAAEIRLRLTAVAVGQL